jgi:hypothetical protein
MKKLVILAVNTLGYNCGETQQKTELSLEYRVKKNYQKVITIDTHDDINFTNFTDSVNDI